jgi:hypothetical protein
MKTENLLLLDFDGVLQTAEHYNKMVREHANLLRRYKESVVQPDKVELLNAIFEKVPNLHLVISSRWGEIEFLINKGFKHADRFLGFTQRKMSSTKSNEVGWTVNDLPSLQRFLILNDFNSHNMDYLNEVCVCKDFREYSTNPENGLTEEDVQQIVEFFKR